MQRLVWNVEADTLKIQVVRSAMRLVWNLQNFGQNRGSTSDSNPLELA